MNEVFELGGSLVQDDIAHNIMRLIAEGIFLYCTFFVKH